GAITRSLACASRPLLATICPVYQAGRKVPGAANGLARPPPGVVHPPGTRVGLLCPLPFEACLMPHPPGRWRWLRTHPYTAATVVAFGVLAVTFCLRQDSEWDEVYVRAAQRLRQGQDLYERRDGYLYPPFMAWAALPFAS